MGQRVKIKKNRTGVKGVAIKRRELGQKSPSKKSKKRKKIKRK